MWKHDTDLLFLNHDSVATFPTVVHSLPPSLLLSCATNLCHENAWLACVCFSLLYPKSSALSFSFSLASKLVFEKHVIDCSFPTVNVKETVVFLGKRTPAVDRTDVCVRSFLHTGVVVSSLCCASSFSYLLKCLSDRLGRPVSVSCCCCSVVVVCTAAAAAAGCKDGRANETHACVSASALE